MFRSIRARLLVTYLLITVLGMMLVSAYLVYAFREFYITRSKLELRGWAEKLAETLAGPLGEDEPDVPQARALTRAFPEPRWATIRVFDAAGRLVAESRSSELPEHRQYDSRGVERALRTRSRVERDLPGMRPDREKRFIAEPVRDAATGRLLGVVRLSLYPVDFERVFAEVRNTAIATLLAAFALCSIVSLLVARGMARPVLEMRRFAEAIGGGRFGSHLQVRSRDELGRLAEQLNRMSDRLMGAERDRREFLAAVSHELRTPVSNVQVTLESLLNGAAEDPALRERFLRAGLDETGRLGTLIRDLMDLARLEAGAVHMRHRELRLAELVEGAAAALEPRLRERALTLAREIPADLHVYADPDRLFQVLMNLLDNAIKFSPEGGTIRCQAATTRGQVRLHVQDQGPGITDEDLPRLFEAFYTADKSRARGTGGTGLGLAIARRIVEAHAGRVVARTLPDSGAEFTVTLPR